MAVPQSWIDEYERHARPLIAYATALVGPAHAEDVVADAVVGLLGRVDLASLEHPRAFLYRCVLNQVRSEARRDQARRRRELRVADDRGRRDQPVDPAAHLDGLGLLAVLSARERAVIYLAYWEDRTPADIAAVLGLGQGTVRRYLARARKKLRAHLSETDAEPLTITDEAENEGAER